MMRLVRLVLVVALGCAGGALVGCSSGASSPAAGPGAIVPSASQAFVTGEVTRLVADDAQVAEPLTSPFTITAVEQGTGSAIIDKALVGGKRTTISWGGGTPLPITGAGGLELGPVHLEVDARGVALRIDGTWSFVPGTYRAGASVAVGTAGLATSRDSVEFTADEQTVFTGRGGVVVRRDLRRVELKGPGKLSISGRLQVQTPDSKRAAGSVTFGPGPFTLTLVPATGGLTIESVLQGTFTAA